MATQDDTLIVSDLHLRPGSERACAADFSRLVSGAAAGARLVLAGDIFDLDWVGKAPQAGEGPTAAAGRLRAILKEFPETVTALREFLSRGGEIRWLPGNHDAELAHPEVQAALQAALGQPGPHLKFENESVIVDFPSGSCPHVEQESSCATDRGAEGAGAGGRALELGPEGAPGRVWVEHGHQYDPDNRFLPDTRAAVARGRLADLPLGCLLTRFLLSRLPYYRERGDQHRTPWDTFRGVLRDFGWRTPWMVLLYFVSGVRIALLAGSPLSKCAPVTMRGPLSVVRRMYLDRMVAGALLVVLLVLAMVVPATAGRLWLLSLCFVLGLALVIPPARRHEFFERARREGMLAARRLLSASVREVILGHTHRTDEVVLPEGRVVFLGAFQFGTARGRPFARLRQGRAELDWLPPNG